MLSTNQVKDSANSEAKLLQDVSELKKREQEARARVAELDAAKERLMKNVDNLDNSPGREYVLELIEDSRAMIKVLDSQARDAKRNADNAKRDADKLALKIAEATYNID